MDKVYDTYLARDPKMRVKSKVEFPVVKGASDYTTQTIVCNSASASSVDFSWTPPSENTFINRVAYVRSTMTFQAVISGQTTATGVPNLTNMFSIAGASTQGASQTYTVPAIPAGAPDAIPAYTAAVNVANNIGAVCMQSFPFHRCATNLKTVINNSNIDLSVPEYLPAMLQLVDQEDLREYSSQCPVLMDRYLNFTDANNYGVANSPFAGYDVSSFKSQILGRGSYPINIIGVSNSAGGGAASSLLKQADGDTITVTFQITTVEPILLPPWCTSKYGNDLADAFLGVNRINVKYSMSANANRVLSSALPSGTCVVTLTDATVGPNRYQAVSSDTALIVQYLNSDATLLVPERCIYNFWQVYNYSTQLSSLAAGTSINGQFTNLQLGEVPSLIVLYCRKQIAAQTAFDPDFFLPITNLSVSFNNRVSLLSQFTPSDLYAMSKRNGLKNVDFFQFLGYAQKYNVAQTSLNAALNTLFLAGSIIVIDPARDLSISSPFITDASTGQFNLSWSANVQNNKSSDFIPELVTLLFNSRMLLCSSGSSEIIQPALNQAQVEQTIQGGDKGDEIPHYELIGGKSRHTGMTHHPRHPMHRKLMSQIVEHGVGGSRSGGMHHPGMKHHRSKLDALLM